MKVQPKRSLQSILMLWFLFFSIIPLSFVSGYSLVLYENSINNELQKRLEGNIREVGVSLAEFENYLINFGKIHASDPTLTYHVSTRNIPAARRVVGDWLKTYIASRIVIFDREGRLIISQRRGSDNQIKPQTSLETGEIYLSDDLAKEVGAKGQVRVREVRPGRGLDIIVYTRVIQKDGKTAGYLEEIIELGEGFTEGLKKRLNLEAVLFDDKGVPAAASIEDFHLLPKDFFPAKIGAEANAYFDITSRGKPYGMMVRRLVDVQKKPIVALGLAASKVDSQKVLSRIKLALFTIVALILLLLIPTLIYVSKSVVRPVTLLVEATERMEDGKAEVRLENRSDTEIGILVESFNRMARNISGARKELEKKISEIQHANTELHTTQDSLVQSAKMASVGQLVAGVAHELNNPIGFIYSNMAHLREYVEKLDRVLKVAETGDAKKLKIIKEDVDFEFVMQDLPKLIASCEDGARRTRDIVLGLRNFSRPDDAQLKRVNLREGIESSLQLLTGELKNRIKVHKDYGPIEEVRCYTTQLNQVFVNIISNAAQAIKDEGEIFIKTWQEARWAYVSIRDTGPGIPADAMSKVFDPFFTTKPVGKGTGLGLSISYGIVKKHAGEIQVNSVSGNGAEFIIKVPVDGPPDTVSG